MIVGRAHERSARTPSCRGTWASSSRTSRRPAVWARRGTSSPAPRCRTACRRRSTCTASCPFRTLLLARGIAELIFNLAGLSSLEVPFERVLRIGRNPRVLLREVRLELLERDGVLQEHRDVAGRRVYHEYRHELVLLELPLLDGR